MTYNVSSVGVGPYNTIPYFSKVNVRVRGNKEIGIIGMIVNEHKKAEVVLRPCHDSSSLCVTREKRLNPSNQLLIEVVLFKFSKQKAITDLAKGLDKIQYGNIFLGMFIQDDG